VYMTIPSYIIRLIIHIILKKKKTVLTSAHRDACVSGVYAYTYNIILLSTTAADSPGDSNRARYCYGLNIIMVDIIMVYNTWVRR